MDFFLAIGPGGDMPKILQEVFSFRLKYFRCQTKRQAIAPIYRNYTKLPKYAKQINMALIIKFNVSRYLFQSRLGQFQEFKDNTRIFFLSKNFFLWESGWKKFSS